MVAQFRLAAPTNAQKQPTVSFGHSTVIITIIIIKFTKSHNIT